MKIADIPQFLSASSPYEVDVSWTFLDKFLADVSGTVDLCPEFQRGHVWTQEQQISYVEFVLRGGRCSRELIFAVENWDRVGGEPKPWLLVDGLQRLTAVRTFLRNELPVFGHLLNEFEDGTRGIRWHLGFRVRVIDTDYVGALQLYIDLNAGGTPHAAAEIERVRNLLRSRTEEKTKR